MLAKDHVTAMSYSNLVIRVLHRYERGSVQPEAEPQAAIRSEIEGIKAVFQAHQLSNAPLNPALIASTVKSTGKPHCRITPTPRRLIERWEDEEQDPKQDLGSNVFPYNFVIM